MTDHFLKQNFTGTSVSDDARMTPATPRVTQRVRRGLAITLVALLTVFSVAPQGAVFGQRNENPYNKFRNKERGRGEMSRENELKFAEAAHQEIAKTNRFVDDPQINEYVNRVGRTIAARSERTDLPYQFYVIANDQVNAFTPGGGRVYIYTGLMRRMTTEGQLAAVLGHEVGHNVGYHLSATIRRQQQMGLFAGILGAVLGNGAIGTIGQAATGLLANGFLFKRSRDQEREADFLGLYDMREAGYNTDEMNGTFRLLGSLSRSNPGGIDKVFASHPPASERLQNTQREIAENLRGSDQRGVRTTSAFADMQRRLANLKLAPPPTNGGGRLRSGFADFTGAAAPPDRQSPPPQEPDESGDTANEAGVKLMRRIGAPSSARLVSALRCDLSGDGEEKDLVIVYVKDNGLLYGIASIKGTPYILKNRRLENLPFRDRDLKKIRVTPPDGKKRGKIILMTGREDSNTNSTRLQVDFYWEWTGEEIRYLGSNG